MLNRQNNVANVSFYLKKEKENVVLGDANEAFWYDSFTLIFAKATI